MSLVVRPINGVAFDWWRSGRRLAYLSKATQIDRLANNLGALEIGLQHPTNRLLNVFSMLQRKIFMTKDCKTPPCTMYIDVTALCKLLNIAIIHSARDALLTHVCNKQFASYLYYITTHHDEHYAISCLCPLCIQSSSSTPVPDGCNDQTHAAYRHNASY